jgi:predicted ester cyclase
VTGPAVDQGDDRGVELANKAMVLRYHERLWGQGDLTAIAEAWAPDAVVHMTGFDGGGIDTVTDDAVRYQGAFIDVTTTVADLLADGDRVVLRWETSGRHVGPYGDVAATGKVITMRGIDVLRLDGGRIVEAWSMWDGLDVYEQFGLLPGS